MSVILITQFLLTFKDKSGNEVQWIVSGEDHLDTVCKTLRWNGLNEYSVRVWGESDDDHKNDPRAWRYAR